MIVMKFGGTSVGSGKMINRVVDLVSAQKGERVVVVSAVGGVTNKLISIANRVAEAPSTVVEGEVSQFYDGIRKQHHDIIDECVKDPKVAREVKLATDETLGKLKIALLGVGYLQERSAKVMDYIMSFGERLSAPIVAGAFESCGMKSTPLTGFEAGLVTDSNYGSAHPIHDESRKRVRAKLLPLTKAGVIPVVTGFIGADEKASITTLGRGGSDYSGALFGNYLSAKEVQIWTDVDGILSANPAIVPHAKLIDTMSYEEAMDLAYFGAKVIHFKMVEPAMVADIPVRVLNTFNPSSKGTLIVRKQKTVREVIKAVSAGTDVVVVNLAGVGMAGTPNIAGKIFSALGESKINILMISGSSESNISFVISRKDAEKAVSILKSRFHGNGVRGIDVIDSVAVVTVVGAGMAGTKGIASKVFKTIADAGVNIIMIAQGSSEVNITFVVREKDVEKAIKALHKRFIE
jgi:aspartate kinase